MGARGPDEAAAARHAGGSSVSGLHHLRPASPPLGVDTTFFKTPTGQDVECTAQKKSSHVDHMASQRSCEREVGVAVCAGGA